MAKKTKQVDPSKIMQVGLGFWASKVLLSAVELELFTLLSSGPKDANQIRLALGLHERGLFDFLDTLTAIGFLTRSGILESAKYSNPPDVEAFLVKGKPAYVGGMLTMANHRLYGFWGNLEDALKTGKPQNESKTGDAPLFEAIYAEHETLVDFLKAMSSIQMGNFMALAEKFDFTPYKTVCDMGGANGSLSIVLAGKYAHLKCISFDLPPVEPVANEHIHAMNMAKQVSAVSGDFFKDQFPVAEVITMGNVLHDWGEEDKLFLIRKVFNALPEGGVFIAIENLIDNERRQNAFGLMMSLNMLIETDKGFDYTPDDFSEWTKEVGFRRSEVIPLAGPSSAAIAYK